jgi:aspartate/methionine/tyrosine aminotransferase
VRELVRNELSTLGDGIELPPAEGAFYFLPRIATKLAPMELVERLVKEFGVAVIPGTTFGIDQGCTIRVAYGALSKETVAQGIGRLVRGLGAICEGT